MNTDDAATVVRKLRVMADEAISHGGRAARSKRDAELLLQAARLLERFEADWRRAELLRAVAAAEDR